MTMKEEREEKEGREGGRGRGNKIERINQLCTRHMSTNYVQNIQKYEHVHIRHRQEILIDF